MKDIIDNKTIRNIASEVGLSERQVYNIKSKIMNTLNSFEKDVVLKEVIQADEKYIRLSFKGTRKENMPRKSRRNGFEDRKPGISKEQVCVIVAIDSYDNIIIKVVGLGPASIKMIEKALGNKVEKGSIIVTDSKVSYKKFAKDNGLNLKQIPHKKHKIEEYHLGELNSLMGEIELYIKNARGLSTRHLQDNLNLIKYKKVLKYTIDYLEQSETFLNYSLIQSTVLKSKDICKSKFPVDITNLYNSNFK